MCVVFEEKWRFLKDALWGGGGVPTPAGLVDGGVDQGKGSGKGCWKNGVLKDALWVGGVDGGVDQGRALGGYPPELAWWTGVRKAGQGLGVQGLRFRGHGQGRSKEKWLFLKGALWGGYPPQLAVDGGVDPKKGEGWGLVGQRGASQGLAVGGGARASVPGG